MANNLPSNENNEAERTAAIKRAREQVLNSMRSVESFGKNSRSEKNLPPTEKSKNKIDYDQELSDISATF